VKGMRTPLYKLKKKLIEHQHQITITETWPTHLTNTNSIASALK
jgi:hypothetical protein